MEFHNEPRLPAFDADFDFARVTIRFGGFRRFEFSL
jgi:hypothetical protein